MIYLDNNATTRVGEEAITAMRRFLVSDYANPASAIGHFLGLDRAMVIEKKKIAAVLKIESPDQLCITSGATEANNLALLGAARREPERRHVIVSSIEHPSVLEVADQLERAGYRITRLPVTRDGLLTVSSLQSALGRDTLLVSVMLANNETGVIQPIASLANAVKQMDSGILFHTDATQAVGKVPIDLENDFASVDLLSFSAHKFHGPKGVGGLFVRDTRSLQPITFGGGQQLGLRPGTENPGALAAMCAALSTVVRQDYARIAGLRALVERELFGHFRGARVLGQGAARLPNTSKVYLPGQDGDELVDALAASGVAISTGSACAHGARKPSHVALAMGLSFTEAQQCIRVSLAFDTTEQDIREFVRAIAAIHESRVASATASRG
jgi:cysteine desulfurase